MERDSALEKQEIINYLRKRVLPIFEPLELEIMKKRPQNIYQFCLDWLQEFESNENPADYDEDEQLQDEMLEEKKKNRRRRNKGREGVSGQVYSSLKSEAIELFTQDKSEETKLKIMVKLRNCLLFKNLSQANLESMIESMQRKEFEESEVVIRQGDLGEELYLVESGKFKCEIQGNSGIEKVYGSSEVFGELSLLYNTRRASTITAQEYGVLYSLDRNSFNQILRDSILNKTKICEQILNKSEIFSTMNQGEKEKLCDSLKEAKIEANRYIIREGQLGDRFFIVMEGNLVAEKIVENGESKPVYYYKKGDYFGEIALIRNVPRQASVKSLTSAKLAYIQRSSFKRLLGSLEQLLKRNEERYKKIKKEVIKNKF